MKVLKMTMTTLLLYWSKAALPHCRELIVDLFVDLRREGKLRDRQRLVAELKEWFERQDGAPPVDNRLPTSWQSCIRE
jgi:hypothetical protein